MAGRYTGSYLDRPNGWRAVATLAPQHLRPGASVRRANCWWGSGVTVLRKRSLPECPCLQSHRKTPRVGPPPA